MNWRGIPRLLPLAVAVAAGPAAAGGYLALSKEGDKVLSACNPYEGHARTDCRVESLPGTPGYRLIAARSAPLVYNDVKIGTLHEKVWRHRVDGSFYIFGARIALNAEAWDSSGAPFSANDLLRQTLPWQPVAVAYHEVAPSKPLQKAGRTVQGLNEYEEKQPERNNTWADFRIDAGTAQGSPNSPWLLMKTRAPNGHELAPLGLRLLNSQVDDFLDAVDLYTASYQPKGVPPPDDDDDDDDD